MEKMSIFPTFKCAAAINFHHVQMLKINGGGGGIKVVENYSNTNAPTPITILDPTDCKTIYKCVHCIALLPSNA